MKKTFLIVFGLALSGCFGSSGQKTTEEPQTQEGPSKVNVLLAFDFGDEAAEFSIGVLGVERVVAKNGKEVIDLAVDRDTQALDLTLVDKPLFSTCRLDPSQIKLTSDVSQEFKVRLSCQDRTFSWPSEQEALSFAGFAHQAPVAKIADNGSAAVAWQADTSGASAHDLFLARRTVNDWSKPAITTDRINEAIGSGINVLKNWGHDPYSLALGPNGQGVLAWSQASPSIGFERIYAHRFDDQGDYGPSTDADAISYFAFPTPQSLSLGTRAAAPKAAVSSNGDMDVMMLQANQIVDGSQTGKWTERLHRAHFEHASQTWTLPAGEADTPLLKDEGSGADPQIAHLPDGRKITAFVQSRFTPPMGDAGLFLIDESIPTQNAAPLKFADRIDGDLAAMADGARLAIGDDGNDAILAWTAYDGLSYHVMVSEKMDGIWRHPTSLAASLSPPGAYPLSSHVDVAMGSHGRVAVVWQDVNTENLYVATRDNGQWTKPADINDHLGACDQRPSLVMAGGAGALAWGANGKIFITFMNQGAWDFRVNTAPIEVSAGAREALRPSIDMNAKNDIVLAWQERNAQNEWAIYAAELR